MNMRSIAFLEKKEEESNEMTLTEKRRIRNFKHSMIYKFLF